MERSTIDNRQSTIPSRAIALEPGQPSYRILIVDDRRTNRQLLVKLLSPFAPSTDSGQGFELREAANGQEAIDICTDWKPHLIWMDMRMPVVDGYEATRRIREWERKKQISHLTSHIKIIALTASSLEQERSEIFEAGCDAYLRKPFRETELFELISEHLGLRFVYEEEQYISSDERQAAIDHPLTPEDLAALPDEWLETLKQAAEASDVESLLELTAQIRERDASLADALMRLAEEFEYDEILDLLSR